MMQRMAFGLVTKALLVSGACVPQIAFAQQPGQTSAAASSDTDIIVTAAKREQRLEDVPVAITAVSGEEVASAGVNNTEQLAQVSPSLFITSSQQVGLGAQIRLRGVGTATGNAGLEGSVGFFVDDVFVGRSNTAFGDLVDIERVEVLRGPQGTLFGKSTSAGVISVFTRLPDFYWGGNAKAAVSNHGGMRASARLSGPIVDDKLAFSISGQVHTREGYVDDVVSGADYNNRNRWLVRGQLLFTPTSEFSLRLIAEQSQRDEDSTVAVFTELSDAQRALIVASGGFVPTPLAGPEQNSVSLNGPFIARTNDTNFSATADWKTAAVDIKAIIAYRDSRARKDYDSDFTSVDLYRQTDDLRDRIFSAELQLSRQTGFADLLVGAYYFDAKTDYRVSRRLGSQAGRYFDNLTANVLITPAIFEAGRGLALQDTNQDGEGVSLFTHNIFHISPRLDLTLGLRYQWEEKTGGSTFTYNQATACTITYSGAGSVGANAFLAAIRPASFCAAQTPNFSARYSDDRLTGTAVLSYKLTDNIMAYASFSRGFKSGGINLDPRAGANPRQTFLPENVDSYEIGAKSALFDRKLLLNLAAFTAKYTDFQLNTFDPTAAFVLSNEGSVRSKGIEGDVTVIPFKGLTLRGGLMYNIARYGQDTVNPGLRGNILSNAPKWSGTAGASYETSIGERWSIFGRVDARFQSEILTASNLAAATRQEGYTLLNARLGLRSSDGLEVALFGTNLTDSRYKTIAFATTGGFQSYFGEPRFYGIEVSKRF